MDNNFIMSKLEEKGLDKRFRDNPEAVRRICSLIKSDLEQRSGMTIEEVLEKIDFVGIDGIRRNDFYSINEDGSLSVKLKTDAKKIGEDVQRSDNTQIFSIGKENDELVITESNEEFAQRFGKTIASTGLKFSVFNKNGLEIQRKDVSQSVVVDASIGINSCLDAFHISNFDRNQWQMSPVTEINLQRSRDLATEYYTVEQSKDSRILAFDRDRIISLNRNGIDPEQTYRRLNGSLDGQVKRGGIPNFAPEHFSNHLRGYSDYAAEFYAKYTDEEWADAIQRVYEDLADKSREFRETLFESAKTDKTLSAIVKKLDLVRTSRDEAQSMESWGMGHIVRVEDLQRVYEGVNDKELRTILGRIIETSREANEKEADER